MNRFLCLALCCAVLPFYLMAASNNRRMIETVDILSNSYKVNYAPTEWKKEHWGWSLNKEAKAIKKKIAKNKGMPLKEFQRALRDMLYSTKDYHVSIQFHSTEAAIIPFQVKSANGRYFISYINPVKLSQSSFPYQVGDELVEFDGIPTDVAVQRLIKEEMRGTKSPTDQALGEMMLTERQGILGHYVPKDSVMLTIRSSSRGKLEKVRLHWEYFPECINSPPLIAKGPPLLTQEHSFNTLVKDVKMLSFESEIMKDFALKSGNGGNRNLIGSRVGFLPDLGEVVWRTPSYCYYDAYIYLDREGRQIGYLRIPDYMGMETDLEGLAAIINFFEENTEALVVDQQNNGGGIVFNLYTTCSFFATEPLIVPKHRMRLTQENIMMALLVIDIIEQIPNEEMAQQIFGGTMFGYPIDQNLMMGLLKYMRSIVDEWNAGHTTTDLLDLFGISFINRSKKAHYSKPMVILVNSLDFSCADFFPAIMQDNKRATIFGACTAGAGGCVMMHAFPNQLGIANYRYTFTIAERYNGQPIEDLGVTPDIEYHPTENDLMNDYREFVQVINTTIRNIPNVIQN